MQYGQLSRKKRTITGLPLWEVSEKVLPLRSVPENGERVSPVRMAFWLSPEQPFNNKTPATIERNKIIKVFIFIVIYNSLSLNFQSLLEGCTKNIESPNPKSLCNCKY